MTDPACLPPGGGVSFQANMRGTKAKRAAVGVSVVLASLVVIPVASAHPTTTFYACVKVVSPDDDPCVDRAEGGSGAKIWVNASVTPRHANSQASVWALRPHGEWAKVARVPVEQGRMRYCWVPSEADVYNRTSWQWRFVIPRHASSDTVKVRIRDADF